MQISLFDDVLSVSQLNEYVRQTLAADPFLSMLRISGEISNFKRHSSGHLYFTLKDDGAQVRCAMFRQHAYTLDFKPQDGDHVVMTASASLYAQAGQYQLYVRAMEPLGVGELYRRFEALKRRLAEEGLFDPSLKKPLPFFPATVGIATSETGAALQDMLRILRERNPATDVLVAPCAVQGKGAEKSVIRAMRRLERQGVDVMIIGRGGGSLEDLWAFNEEELARAIAACSVPVISAVGHETDTTIADFCADARAATPSNATEMAVPVLAELQYGVAQWKKRLENAARREIADRRQALQLLLHKLLRHSPEAELALRKRHIAMTNRQLDEAFYRYLAERRSDLRDLENRLARHAPEGELSARRACLAAAGKDLEKAMQGLLREKRGQWERQRDLLRSLNPEGILQRGYAYITLGDTQVQSIGQLRPGDDIDIVLRDGRARATVKE